MIVKIVQLILTIINNYMPDKKISALTSLSPVDDDDLIVVVDVSDTTMASSGTTKKAIKSELKGDKGDDGVDGASIIDAEFSGDDIRFIKDDNTDIILEDAKIELKGEKGDAGVGAEVVTSFGTPTSDEKVPSEKLTKDSLDAKQATLISGTNIKTINSTSLLGKGDITISSPSKATGAELDTGTDDTKFATAKAIKDAHNVPSVAPGTSGNVLTSDGTDWTSAAPAVSATSTTTFTNKRINPRLVTTTSYTTDTGTSLNIANCDQFEITAQAGALKFNNPGGTPVGGQKLIIRIKDNGTARALTYDTQFRAIGVTLPATTIASKTLYMGFIWNNTDSKWDCVAISQEA